MTRTSSRPLIGSVVQVWSERVWPVLAGMLTGLALVGVWLAYGTAGLLLGPVLVYFFIAVTLYGMLNETGYTLGWSLRSALLATVVVVDVMGVLVLSPPVGGIALAVAALGSPPVTDRLSARVRRPRVRPATRSRDERLDQARVDHVFAELVERLEEEGSWGSDA